MEQTSCRCSSVGAKKALPHWCSVLLHARCWERRLHGEVLAGVLNYAAQLFSNNKIDGRYCLLGMKLYRESNASG
jgi:hypothetical protein